MGRSRKLGAEPDSQELGRREASVFGGAQGDLARPGQVKIIFKETDSPISAWAKGLIHWLGAIESPGGDIWGSLDILKEDGQPWCPREISALEPIEKPWEACLDLEWPHALGIEQSGEGAPEKALLWRTKPGKPSWLQAKIALDCVPMLFVMISSKGSDGNASSARRDWQRIEGQLGFKVIKEKLGDDAEPRYYGIAYHMPYRLPSAMQNAHAMDATSPANDQAIWENVHAKLDDLLTRWTSA
jgi:hypothetical protein